MTKITKTNMLIGNILTFNNETGEINRNLSVRSNGMRNLHKRMGRALKAEFILHASAQDRKTHTVEKVVEEWNDGNFKWKLERVTIIASNSIQFAG